MFLNWLEWVKWKNPCFSSLYFLAASPPFLQGINFLSKKIFTLTALVVSKQNH
jgi:hypothetical protein